ncbi:MAG: 50S ribosomal protein L30 [Eubacteriales bacterium]|nr:50S ribosomal protein L30 [Eubacteriales bacterium]
MAQVKITLTKSLIGRGAKQINTAKSLGLTKIGDIKVVEINESVEGKMNIISHLITVDEVK